MGGYQSLGHLVWLPPGVSTITYHSFVTVTSPGLEINWTCLTNFQMFLDPLSLSPQTTGKGGGHRTLYCCLQVLRVTKKLLSKVLRVIAAGSDTTRMWCTVSYSFVWCGLGPLGAGDWLDGYEWHQLPTGLQCTGSYLAEGRWQHCTGRCPSNRVCKSCWQWATWDNIM